MHFILNGNTDNPLVPGTLIVAKIDCASFVKLLLGAYPQVVCAVSMMEIPRVIREQIKGFGLSWQEMPPTVNIGDQILVFRLKSGWTVQVLGDNPDEAYNFYQITVVK